MNHGLTLGKYAPLHRGHQFVIETGIAEMDTMTVIIYDSPETTTTPLPVRSEWIRSLYPKIQLIEAWNGPSEVGYTSELMRKHENYIINTLGVKGITHFYSSEPYGEHMSEALGSVERRVDETRAKVPISATEIRSDPLLYRKYLDPRVYRDLIANIALLGAPCSGKTTLAKKLATEFETQWMPEYGREYWEAHQIDRRLSPEELVEIAETHLEKEEELLLKSNRYLFTDTNAITTATFARYYHGKMEPRLAELAELAISRYDLVFLCDIDIPYDDTWDRSGEVNRHAFQKQVISDLNRRNVPFIILSGTIEARISQVRETLTLFKKYMNTFNLFKSFTQ